MGVTLPVVSYTVKPYGVLKVNNAL
jgi:hypothetical protein